jgi:hypothetical protein
VVLDTRSIEGGMMTVSGKTLEFFFNERFTGPFSSVDLPGRILGDVVRAMQNRAEGKYAIPSLRVGDLETRGSYVFEDIPFGPVYDTLSVIAKRYNVGMSVHWVANGAEHELVFMTRAGVDRTLGQTTRELVRFSPNLDNLANVKELLSWSGAKDLIIVNPPDIPFVTENPIAPMELGNTSTHPVLDLFKRRILEINTEDITEEKLAGRTIKEKRDFIREEMFKRGVAAANSVRRVKVVDGEITPTARHVYKKDYHLGDQVEIEGYFGDPLNGIVTEYIRSYDNTGSRSYPTVASATPPPASVTPT